MRKRLVKVFGEQLSGSSPSPLPPDIPVSVVLKSGDTLFGKLEEQSSLEIRICDARFHKHLIRVPDIDVVIYDHPSPY